ncbi:hypothetical protein FA175_13745 [Pseudomonas aeruginosa]|nr:hypothetical protein [Pseudomonas aeruginosa]MCO1973150.1 hypothetical protein [Pseudomonas aeruginosa]MCO2012247.1 hypothetical protein [Pseudomonas aeruginosa]MCO2412200.1 hypothetical protein [Pseudomonas aeruginosa]MCO3481621.1 hypothetical protein [Pseudomonas aeruginosa]
MRNGIDAVSAPLPTLFVSPPAVFTTSLERLPPRARQAPAAQRPPGSPGIPGSARLQTGAATSH